ncbi:MAG: hypothetical protein HIU82_19180 [Proteobacteria bacterium]|nr:hypothetical protein [Pseudomonadota bacterium]
MSPLMIPRCLSRRRVLAAATAALPLAGCSVLPDPPAARIYRLDPPTIRPVPGPALHTTLAIAMPTAPESLDTDRIALTLGRTRFDYYAESIWTDRVPALVQTLLVEVFENSGRIADVGRGADGLARGYALETDIRAFQARYHGQGTHPPVVAVSLDLHLIALPGRRTVGRSLLAAAVSAADNTLDGVVRGFDAATGEVLNSMVPSVLRMLHRGQTAA